MANDTIALERYRYMGFDFSTFLDDFRQGALAKFGPLFNSSQNDFGAMLMDYVAYGLDALAYYLDRRVTRCFLQLARANEALLLHARSLGYKARSAVSATADVEVTVLSTHASPVVIPVGFQFRTTTGLVFEVVEETTFQPGETVKTIPASEGKTISERFVATGEQSQVFTLRSVPSGYKPVGGSSSVLIAGVEWDLYDFLPFDDVNAYEENFYGTAAQLRFGDGAAGNIPAAGEEILVTYRVCSGVQGNVGAGTIVAAVSPLTADFETVSLLINNPSSAVGGAEEESADQVRALAGKWFKSRRVAVTEEDYDTLAMAFSSPVAGRVAQAKAYITRTSAGDLVLSSQLARIRDAAEAPLTTTTASVASARAALADAVAAVGSISELLVALAADMTTVAGSVSSVQSGIRSAKTFTIEASTDSDDVQAYATGLETFLATIPLSTGASGLTAADRATIVGYISNIKAEATQIKNGMTTVLAASDISLASLGETRAILDNTGVLAGDSSLTTTIGKLEKEKEAIEAAVGEDTTPTGVYADVAAIEAVVVDTVSTVDEASQAITDHIDRYLSMDCQANLITVPVLSKDAGGFYAAPSHLLVRDLQAFLDERRAVEQVVAVVSGEGALVKAVVNARVGIQVQASESVIRAAVESAIVSVLRERVFGASLYVRELYRAVEAVEGVQFTNLSIEGSLDYQGATVTTHLDSDGNLIVSDAEVVTRGSVTVTTEFVQRRGA